MGRHDNYVAKKYKGQEKERKIKMKMVKKKIGYISMSKRGILNRYFWRIGWYKAAFGQHMIELPGFLIFFWKEEKFKSCVEEYFRNV